MFRVGDQVYHKQFGYGEVARTSGADCHVYFDNIDNNPTAAVEPPPTEKRERINANGDLVEDIVVIGPSPLDGKVIHWDEPPQEVKGIGGETFRYPTKPGYFTIVKAAQAMTAVFSKKTNKLEWKPMEGIVDINMTDNETSAKYKVRVNGNKYPLVYTARKVTTDTLEGAMRDF